MKGFSLNKCHFLGKLTHVETEIENGVPVCTFELEIEEFRKGKGSEGKIRDLTYLTFEAWDSAAIAIEKYSEVGCLLAIEAVARNTHYEDSEQYLDTYFRVTSFKILHG